MLQDVLIFILGQDLALHRGLGGDYLLCTPRVSLISGNKEGIIFLPGKNLKCQYLILTCFFFSRLSRYLASGALCRRHHSTPFFRLRQKMLINKRDPAAAGDNVDLDITTLRQRERLHLLLYGGAFGTCLFFWTLMEWRWCFEEEK